MKTYVLVDFENVQPTAFVELSQIAFQLLIFVGQNQTKVPISIASAFQKLGPSVEYIQASGTGKNALDFHIAYYIGKLSAADPNAMFYIVSKDAGFDPLIGHLLVNRIAATRVADIAEIKTVEAECGSSTDSAIHRAREWLVTTKATLPRTKKTLTSTLAAVLKDDTPTAQIPAIIQILADEGHLRIEDSKVIYRE